MRIVKRKNTKIRGKQVSDLRLLSASGNWVTAGNGRMANMRHFSRGAVGPKFLMVSCRAILEKRPDREA